MDRRVFLGTSAGFAMFGAQALAFSQKDAENYVNVVAAEINAVIASNKSESATVKAFEQIFRRYADTNMIARYALGREARSFRGLRSRILPRPLRHIFQKNMALGFANS